MTCRSGKKRERENESRIVARGDRRNRSVVLAAKARKQKSTSAVNYGNDTGWAPPRSLFYRSTFRPRPHTQGPFFPARNFPLPGSFRLPLSLSTITTTATSLDNHHHHTSHPLANQSRPSRPLRLVVSCNPFLVLARLCRATRSGATASLPAISGSLRTAAGLPHIAQNASPLLLKNRTQPSQHAYAVCALLRQQEIPVRPALPRALAHAASMRRHQRQPDGRQSQTPNTTQRASGRCCTAHAAAPLDAPGESVLSRRSDATDQIAVAPLVAQDDAQVGHPETKTTTQNTLSSASARPPQAQSQYL